MSIALPGWWAGDGAVVTDTINVGIPEWLGQLGAAGLLALTVVLILTGRLVPASTVRRIEKDRDRALAANEVLAETNQVLAGSNQLSLDVVRALDRVVASKEDASP